jgi:hypothetical protein
MARQVLLCAALIVGAASVSYAASQQATPAPITKATTATATVTIQAIDSTARLITIKNDADGTEDIIHAGPEVKRFDQLKVGDKVNIRYYESLVMQLRKPGEASTPAKDVSQTTPTTGKVGTTIARQQTTTVSVVAVDPSVPSITVKTADGHTITRKVQDAKNLQGVSPGDKIDLTYTQAALIDVLPVK